MFSKNEGPADRVIRVVAGVVLIAVGLFLLGGIEASVVGIAVAAFGGWLVVTGATMVCPRYVPPWHHHPAEDAGGAEHRAEQAGRVRKGSLRGGVLTTTTGIPVAVEVFKGSTGDPATLASQVKLKERFGLSHVAVAGDRGMLTKARIRDDLKQAELDWITAVRGPAIAALISQGAIQPSLSGNQDMAEITSPDYPGGRLIACYNPFLEAEQARKRGELLAATEAELAKISAAARRARRPLRGKDNIALAVGNKKKVAKHFITEITDETPHLAAG